MITGQVRLSDLVDAMFTSVSGVILEDFLVLFDKAVAFLEARNIKSEVVARGLVDAKHFEGGSGTSLLVEAVDFKALRFSIVSENLAESFGVAVEVSDDGFGFCEKLFKLVLRELTVGGSDGVIREGRDIDKAEVLLWEIFAKDVERIESFAGNDVTTTGKNIVGVII